MWLRTLIPAAVCLAAMALAPGAAGAVTTLSGRVLAGKHALADAHVRLYAATDERTALGSATADDSGRFSIAYARPSRGAVVYALAFAPGGVRLMSVAHGTAPRTLTINELTTVAAAYSLAQFLDDGKASGPAPGFPNAAATVPSLVDPGTGQVGDAIANPPNGSDTGSLATFNTLADLVAGCTTGGSTDCQALFRAAAPPRGDAPADTLQAMVDVARNPASKARLLFRLRKPKVYGPRLGKAPSSWVLSLKHTDGGYDGPGRMAFDAHGNIWVSNNFQPPGTDAGLGVISLDPTGQARNGSPVTGGGIQGNWWGIAIDRSNRVWLSNFTGNDPNEFTSPDFKGGNATSLFTSDAQALSPATGFQQGPLQAPQGIAVDQRGNVWIANHGNATVTEYPGGDPDAARVFSGGGLHNPFAVAVDGSGNVWVDNGSLDASAPGTLTKIDTNGQVTGPYDGGGMRSPQGMAFDAQGNLWVASLVDDDITEFAPGGTLKGTFRAPSIQGAWATAVDGDGNVWATSFIGEKLTQLCGARTSACPPGMRTGDVISPAREGFTNGGLQHLTAVQVDQSGNVWVANNWASLYPIVGGDGLVEFIGAAPPVRTPLIGPPQRPR
jgi:hypothetical protein